MTRALKLIEELEKEIDDKNKEFVKEEPYKKEDEEEKEEIEVEEEVKPEDEKIPVQELDATDPAIETDIDSDDEHLLAVLDLYFSRLNKKPTAVKSEKLQALVNRLINVMINMPQGEKQARAALKVAIKTMNEDKA